MDEEQDEMTVTNEPALIPLVAAGSSDGVHHYKHGWIPLDGVALRTPKGVDSRPGRMDVYVDGNKAGSIEKTTSSGVHVTGPNSRISQGTVGGGKTEWVARPDNTTERSPRRFKSRKEAAAWVTAEHKASLGSSPMTPGSEPSPTYGKQVTGVRSDGKEVTGVSMGENTKGHIKVRAAGGVDHMVPAGQVRLAEDDPSAPDRNVGMRTRPDGSTTATRVADRIAQRPSDRQLPTEQSPMPRRADDPGGAPADRAPTHQLHDDIVTTLSNAPKSKDGKALPEGQPFEAGSPHQVLHNDHGPNIVSGNMKQAERSAANRNALLADTAQHLDRMAAKPGVDEKSASRLREHAATARQLAGVPDPDTTPAAPADRTGQWVETPHGTGQVTSSYTDPDGKTTHTVRLGGGKGRQTTKQVVEERDIKPLGITTDPGSDVASRIGYDHLTPAPDAPATPAANVPAASADRTGQWVETPHGTGQVTSSYTDPDGDTFHTVRFGGGKGRETTKQMVHERDTRPLGITTDPGSDVASRVGYDHLTPAPDDPAGDIPREPRGGLDTEPIGSKYGLPNDLMSEAYDELDDSLTAEQEDPSMRGTPYEDDMISALDKLKSGDPLEPHEAGLVMDALDGIKDSDSQMGGPDRSAEIDAVKAKIQAGALGGKPDVATSQERYAGPKGSDRLPERPGQGPETDPATALEPDGPNNNPDAWRAASAHTLEELHATQEINNEDGEPDPTIDGFIDELQQAQTTGDVEKMRALNREFPHWYAIAGYGDSEDMGDWHRSVREALGQSAPGEEGGAPDAPTPDAPGGPTRGPIPGQPPSIDALGEHVGQRVRLTTTGGQPIEGKLLQAGREHNGIHVQADDGQVYKRPHGAIATAENLSGAMPDHSPLIGRHVEAQDNQGGMVRGTVQKAEDGGVTIKRDDGPLHNIPNERLVRINPDDEAGPDANAPDAGGGLDKYGVPADKTNQQLGTQMPTLPADHRQIADDLKMKYAVNGPNHDRGVAEDLSRYYLLSNQGGRDDEAAFWLRSAEENAARREGGNATITPADRFREPAVDPNAPATGLEAKYGTPGPGGRPTGRLSGPTPDAQDLPQGQPVVFRDDQGQVRMGRVAGDVSTGVSIRDTEGNNHTVPRNRTRRVTMGDYEKDSGLSPDEIAGGTPDTVTPAPDASPAERDPVEWDANATKPWSQIHNDFKGTDANGNRSVLARTRNGATVSVPWRGPGPDSGTSGAADEVTPADPAAEAQALRDRVKSPSGRSAKMQRAFQAANEGDYGWLQAHGFDARPGSKIYVDDNKNMLHFIHPNGDGSTHGVNGNGQAMRTHSIADKGGPFMSDRIAAARLVHDPGASGVPSDVGGQAEVDQLRDRVSMARTGRSAKMQRAFTAAEQGDTAWLASHGFDAAPGQPIHINDDTGEIAIKRPEGDYSVHTVNGNGRAAGWFQHPAGTDMASKGYRQVGTPEGNGPLASDRNRRPGRFSPDEASKIVDTLGQPGSSVLGKQPGYSRAARNAARSGQDTPGASAPPVANSPTTPFDQVPPRKVNGQDLKTGDIFKIVQGRYLNTGEPYTPKDADTAVYKVLEGGHMGNGGDPTYTRIDPTTGEPIGRPSKMMGLYNTSQVIGRDRGFGPKAPAAEAADAGWERVPEKYTPEGYGIEVKPGAGPGGRGLHRAVFPDGSHGPDRTRLMDANKDVDKHVGEPTIYRPIGSTGPKA